MADRLTLSVRNFLAQQPDVTALLGSSPNWDTWIFADQPWAKVENSSSAMVVIQQDDQWAVPNEHNTMKFPRLFVDVWADPSRNADKSIRVRDADDRILKIQEAIFRHMHTVSMNYGGMPICWGTAEQMANYTGVLISGSSRKQETKFSPMANNDGGRMGSCVYGVNLI